MAEYSVYSRNADLSKDREITTFSSLEMVSQYNHAGRWKMTGSGAVPFSYGNGIIVERDGINIFSGVVTKVETEMSASEFINRAWIVYGIDDLACLAWRCAHPDPSGLTITASQYDTRTGNAETVILGYVEANCGATAHTDRRFPNFVTATSLGRGTAVTDNARFHPLLDFIYNIAQRGNVGYRVRYDSDLDKLVFEVFEPTDRTAEVIFSNDFGNLQSFKYILEAPKANAVIALGQGQGTSRDMGTASDATSIAKWGRIELVKDQRNEPDNSALTTWANTEISERGQKEGYAIVPVQIGTVGFTYGEDYFIGDLVTIADNGIVLEETITEVSISLTENGEEIVTPTIGKVKDIPLKETMEKVKTLERRVSTLETSQ